MSYFITITVLFVVFNYGSGLTYPVFGTKRYHRANIVSPILAAPIPLYTAVPQYYDGEQPYPVVFPNEELYPNSYYYPDVPHRETHPQRNSNSYRTYGMPTYRGEYKPQPYYYAHAPTYNYYDDHIDSGNPLDDLHEEILQEDERKRQRDMLPIGQETWFENNERPDQSLMNANAAFLRNLIAYNKQLEAAKEQQQYQAEQFQNQDSTLNSNEDVFDDYMNDEELYDMQPTSNINTNNNYFYDTEKAIVPPPVPELRVTKNEDKDVKDLKSLIANHKNIPPIRQQFASLQNIQPQQSLNRDPHHQFAQITKNSNNNNNNNNNQQQTASFQQYDDPEYDDSWINWDKKRSVSSPKRDQSIYNFSDRKITNERESHKIPPKPSKITTTTISPRSNVTPPPPIIDNLEQSLKKLSGQKEVVLPRPSNPVRGITTSTSTEFDENSDAQSSSSSSSSENKRGNNKESMYDTIKQLLALEHHHEKTNQPNEQLTRLQKRYIGSEESLVQELNGLKRMSV